MNKNIWFACNREPATAEMRIPVAEPVNAVRLIIMINVSKPVFKASAKTRTHRVMRRSDWKNPISFYHEIMSLNKDEYSLGNKKSSLAIFRFNQLSLLFIDLMRSLATKGEGICFYRRYIK